MQNFLNLSCCILIALTAFVHHVQIGHARSANEILADMPHKTLTQYIRPAYDDLHLKSKTLATALNSHCAAPDPQSFERVNKEFQAAVFGFAKIEHLRFGPAVEQYRLERLNYWPDRKGRGIKRLRKLLKSKKPEMLEQGALAKKSVAIQGFGALEYLLYGKGSDVLKAKGSGDTYRCQLAAAISRNIAVISGEISTAWQAGGAASKEFLEPGPDNQLYRNRKEVIAEIYKSITSGFKFLHDLKVLQLLGKTIDTAKPRRAAFWRSGLAVRMIKADLAAINELATVSGFVELLPTSSVNLKEHVGRVIRQINTTLDSFPNDPAQIVREEENRARFKQVMKQITHVNAGYARHFAVAADLPLGFNAADGDG